MKINIFGLGYVGCVTAACLASQGHKVVGLDIDQLKINMINSGKSPIFEAGLQELIENAVTSNSLQATINNINNLSEDSDISFICVGTPSNENGSLRLDSVINVAKEIGLYISKIKSYHVVNVRSTMLPGTIEKTVIPILEKTSKKKVGLDFGICMNPEFMREGTSIHDYYNPPFNVIGEFDSNSGDIVSQLYTDFSAPLIRTRIAIAEMLKYACNAFHALKVTFANEIGNICKKLNIDSHEVMQIFCDDTKLNISPYYLKPGFAFGGSCLPKDLRALLYKAKMLDLHLPVLNAILPSNELQIRTALTLLERKGKKNVGVLGLSFKPGTDDLRETPIVSLIEYLIGKGHNLKIYDKEVSLSKIIGTNKEYIEKTIPHISRLMTKDLKDVLSNSDLIVIAKKTEEFMELIPHIDSSKLILDLVRVIDVPHSNTNYEGIAW